LKLLKEKPSAIGIYMYCQNNKIDCSMLEGLELWEKIHGKL